MPRGFKRDAAATKARRFEDRRSFVSRDGHDLLYGNDKAERRKEIFARDKGTCQCCGRVAPEHGFDGYRGEWHHTYKEKKVKRCDCMHGGEVRCGRFVSDCHTREHVKPRFGEKGQ